MIVVEHLSKQYQIGQRARYLTLRETASGLARRAFGAGSQSGAPSTSFFALQDVSFRVGAGEVVGIVGRNGAGKSTLLKILSRITWPTSGRVSLYGRWGSLLEVGAGFHSELTGRENVYLSGSVLGMSQVEVRRKFDAIVDFSGIEKFIETPVKYYSSGMYLRLAFAVASHLEPEILFIDEALAVGDAEFQRRCFHKIQEIGERGHTILFVSHALQTVTRLCQRAIWLEGGRVLADGDSHQVVADYLQMNPTGAAARIWPDPTSAPGDEEVRLRSVRIVTAAGDLAPTLDVTQSFGVELGFDVSVDGHVIVPRLEFCNGEGACLFWSFEVDSEWHRRPRPPGHYVATAWVPGHYLPQGLLVISVTLYSFQPWWKIHVNEGNVVCLKVLESQNLTTARGDYTGYIPGFVRPLLHWSSDIARVAN